MAKSIENLHYLKNKWTLWTHLPNETDWGLNSYKNITTFDTVEYILTLYENLPENIIKYCMLFIMKEGITPVWEDEQNRNGGCFSYKITTQEADEKWFDLCGKVLSETLSSKECYNTNINGISITPKKNANVIRIWLQNNELVNPESYNINITKFSTLLYKKHTND